VSSLQRTDHCIAIQSRLVIFFEVKQYPVLEAHRGDSQIDFVRVRFAAGVGYSRAKIAIDHAPDLLERHCAALSLRGKLLGLNRSLDNLKGLGVTVAAGDLNGSSRQVEMFLY
jgi:hypothetical protein